MVAYTCNPSIWKEDGGGSGVKTHHELKWHIWDPLGIQDTLSHPLSTEKESWQHAGWLKSWKGVWILLQIARGRKPLKDRLPEEWCNLWYKKLTIQVERNIACNIGKLVMSPPEDSFFGSIPSLIPREPSPEPTAWFIFDVFRLLTLTRRVTQTLSKKTIWW